VHRVAKSVSLVFSILCTSRARTSHPRPALSPQQRRGESWSPVDGFDTSLFDTSLFDTSLFAVSVERSGERVASREIRRPESQKVAVVSAERVWVAAGTIGKCCIAAPTKNPHELVTSAQRSPVQPSKGRSSISARERAAHTHTEHEPTVIKNAAHTHTPRERRRQTLLLTRETGGPPQFSDRVQKKKIKRTSVGSRDRLRKSTSFCVRASRA
jgi:hypothetical protein